MAPYFEKKKKIRIWHLSLQTSDKHERQTRETSSPIRSTSDTAKSFGIFHMKIKRTVRGYPRPFVLIENG